MPPGRDEAVSIDRWGHVATLVTRLFGGFPFASRNTTVEP